MCEMPPFELLVKGTPETFNTMEAILIVSGSPLELRGKVSLLKTLYNLVTEHGEIK